MASSWIVKRGDKQAGPFTSPQLRSLAKSGQLRPTDMVTRQGSHRFVPAEEIKGLTFPASVPGDDVPEYALVEIIDDEEPVLVVEAEEESNIVDYDYSAEDGDDEPEPPRPREQGSRMRGVSRTSRRRGDSRRGQSPAASARPRTSRKGTEEEDAGPWLNLVYGLGCLAAGICFFIALGKEDPSTWETRRGALLVLAIRLIYALGGRWTVLGVFALGSALFFWAAANQFRRRS